MPLLIDYLLDQLRETADFNPHDEVAPVAILWPDKDKEWGAAIKALATRGYRILMLGEYDAAKLTGPAIWIRIMLDSPDPLVATVHAPAAPALPPIIYLPGVSRQDLRPTKDCIPKLSPLVELLYRGVVWSQRSHRDWTVYAFLVSKDTLALTIPSEISTKQAMIRALPQLLELSTDYLRSHTLNDLFFNGLVQTTPEREILRWIGNPDVTRSAWSSDQWEAFCSLCKKEYKFDPVRDGVTRACELLGGHSKKWDDVWKRLKESPAIYPGLRDRMRSAKPGTSGLFSTPEEAWPQDVEEKDRALANQFENALTLNDATLRTLIKSLEEEHRSMRDWLWSGKDHTPYLFTLEALARLVKSTSERLRGESAQAVAQHYSLEGWLADEASLLAIASAVDTPKPELVQQLVQRIYQPWLESAAEHLQTIVRRDGMPTPAIRTQAIPGKCIVFVDGLRYDVAKRLEQNLGTFCQVDASWDWSPIPPVTPTAKYWVSPINGELVGSSTEEAFVPTVKQSGKSITADLFRKLLEQLGVQLLDGSESGDPTGCAWLEIGEFDSEGHSVGMKLANRIEENVREICKRVKALTHAGWKEIEIVTDHGWLLLPNLPSAKIPKELVSERWSRCATIKPDTSGEFFELPWFWNAHVRIGLAPGIRAFKNGVSYSHGSVTVQECVVPRLLVKNTSSGPEVAISKVDWKGMRCTVILEHAKVGWSIDIRTRQDDPDSSLIDEAKPITESGVTSVLVTEEESEGRSVNVVLLDSSDVVRGRQITLVGG